MSTTPPPQIGFALGNPGAPDTLYISADPKENALTLTLTANVAVALTPAEPVPQAQAGAAAGSLFYLDLKALGIDAKSFAGFALKADGWVCQAFPQDAQICFSPTAAGSLAAGQPVGFNFTGFVLPAAPSAPAVALKLDTYRAPPVARGSFPAVTSTQVAVTPPPGGKADLHQALAVTLLPQRIALSQAGLPPVANRLTLTLSQIVGGPTAQAGDDTVFTLSVVYATDAEGFGALMKPAQGSQISIPVPQQGGWTPTNVDGLQGRSWQLVPLAGTTLPSAGGAPVSFDIEPVVSDLQPGPTVLLLRYSGVPNYADGAFAITLLKEPHVRIDSFTATPAVTPLDNGSARIHLAWSVANAGTLILDPIHADVTGRSSFEATIRDTTTFTLTAYGADAGDVDNLAIANATATVIPVLRSFQATPAALSVDDFAGGSASVALRWALNAPAQSELELSSSTTGPYATRFQTVGTTTVDISGPQLFTLKILGDSDPRDRWQLYVPAFTLQAREVAGVGGGYAVAAPGASYVAVSQQNSGQIAILSTANYSPIATVSCGDVPQGLVFAPDGSVIYVANKASCTLGVVRVTENAGAAPPWSFAPESPIPVNGSPAKVALSPAADYLYATVSASSGPGTLATVRLADRSVSYLGVGHSPYGVAVTPAGSQLFVSNSDDGTVSQIGIAPNGTAQLIRTLTDLPGAMGLAVTPDGNTLLVVCAGNGTLQLLDATAPDSSPRAVIQLGGMPVEIALDPSGAYAFVTDFVGARVCLINIAARALVGTPLKVAGAPQAISLSPDGMLAFVGHTSQLTVVSLQTYLLRSNPPACGGYVTDVAVSADGRSAFVWADASSKIKGSAPASGLHVYDVPSETLLPAFAGTPIVQLCVPAAAASPVGFLTQLGQSSLYPFDTAQLTLQSPLPIPAKGGCTRRQPLALAAAADASRVFALVADGERQFSIVVFTQGAGGYTLSDDLTLYTAAATPLEPKLAAAPDGSAAYTYDGTHGNLWSITHGGSGFTRGQPLSLGVPAVAGILPSPDGSKLYLAGQKQFVTEFFVVDCAKWSVQTFTLTEPATQISIHSMALSPDGTRILVSDPTGGTLRFIDTASLRFLQTIGDPDSLQGPAGVCMAPDQSRLFVAALSGQLATAIQVRPQAKKDKEQ